MAIYTADPIFAPVSAVKALVDAGHTPFYLYHAQGIQDSIRALHQGFSWMPDYQNYFPLRENLNPAILQLLAQAGTGVTASSRAELELACACGFSGSQLLYEPCVRDPAAERLALDRGAVWLLNSALLVPDVPPECVILRYNPCDLPLSPPMKQAVVRSKNGLNRTQLLQTAQTLHQMGVSRLGLALQVSSYSLKPGFWARKAQILFELMEALRKQNIPVWCCQVGESAGLSYHPKVDAPELPAEIQRLKEAWLSLPEQGRPVLQTAVSSRLLEPHGILVTRVLEVRAIYRTFLVLDAGISQYCRPALKQAYRHVSVLGRNELEGRRLYSLVGDLPDSFDRLVVKGRMLPPVEPGDACVVHDVGCGGRSMPVLYGLRPVAAEFLYEPDGTMRPIAPGRTAQEVLDFLTAW